MANQIPGAPRANDPSSAKEELLSYLLENEGVQRHSSPGILARETLDPPPLSFAQERFWFLDQFEPNQCVYTSCKAERLIGPLNVAALEASLNAIIRRHEVLRTTFPAPDGKPIQQIAPELTVRFPIILLEGMYDEDHQAAVRRAVADETRNPFDLSRGPLMRAKLLRLKEDEHVLLLTFHQIVFDSWSVGIFFRELWILYEAYANGQSPILENLSIQYADFAAWQRQRLQGEVLQVNLSYWRRQLRDPSAGLSLPTDRPRPMRQSFVGAKQSVRFSEPLTKALNEFSRQQKVTLFMTLLAAFKILLYRYTGCGDVVVGCPIVNRSLPEIENLIGSFLNTLVLRTHLSGHLRFTEFLSQVRHVCLDAYAHQELPFEKLVEELQPIRDLGRNPLFQVMFAFQNTKIPDLSFRGLRSEAIEIDGSTSKLDLTLSLTENQQRLGGFFQYSADLFDQATVERMSGHLETLLESIVADPSRRILELPILTATERHQLLKEWNDTEKQYSTTQLVHVLFEIQVGRTPDAVAVVFENEKLTYRQLNARANQLAHYLKKWGVGPEKLVGVLMERSMELVVGLLGVLKAGGAYVPLEPSYPMERLAFMLEDSQISVLLTHKHISKAFKIVDSDSQSSIRDPKMKVVSLDFDWEIIGRESEQNLNGEASAANLAYVIYTSGSTGKPKGVMITHQGICNRLLWMQDAYQLMESDHVLQKAPISFDVSVWEFFWPLMNGARLVMARPGGHQDGAYLAELIAKQRITVLHFVPSMLQVFLEQQSLECCDCLRLVICSGEALRFEVQERFFARLGAELHNLYGPTEAAVDVTYWPCERGSSRSTIPIGHPITNTQIYILNLDMQPVPIGVPGELHIGGDGLARGYLNRPELTAERFVANPFSSEPGARLYRTGDLARYLPDGNIEFLGRIDNQVKIRGYRIELGEIECVLSQHPAVRVVLVVAQGDITQGEYGSENPKSDKRLIAYFIPIGRQPSTNELRDFLKRKLPEFMIPSFFISIEALPLTPNGKIDPEALPLPTGDRPQLAQDFIEPRTEIEELVAQVWREVLKLEKIGGHDNFFELGGHSLLATRVVARLRTNFNVDLPLRKLFELPTVAALAEHIDFQRRHQSGISVPPIVPVSRDLPIPLSSSQGRLWFLQKLDPGLIAYNIPATFRITGALNVPALKQALDEIVNRHEILRTRIVESDGQPSQEILPNVTIQLRVLDLSHLPQGQAEAERERLSAEDTGQPYNLAEAPLMRAELLRFCDDDHFLILNFHHVVCDGSSLIIFYQELTALYESFLEGKDSNLPSLPVQYADYVVWQREQLQGEIVNSQLAYWKRQLGTGLAALNLPTDYERPIVQSYRGARLTKTLSEELSKGLKDLSRREGVTLFMTLLATLDILLSRHTGQEDIIVGSTIAGRNRPETDGLIGFFINALALRTDLSGNPTFPELLKRVREVCLDAYTNQDLPFERVVEEINPQRDLSRNPLFQVMFNMADTTERVLKLAGCQTVKLWPFAPEAKFDIVLHAPEVDGRIELAIVYNADLFSEYRIVNLFDQFLYLLSQVPADPQRRIDEFSLVTPAAVSAIPDPTEPLDDTWEGSIYELVAKQAERVPDFPAVIDSDSCWSYRELDQRTNQLANYLIAQGIKPKDVVAIYAQRSAALVIALLGILKAGAAFVILDPAYPASRLISYLRIARPRAWLHINGAGEMAEELKEFLTSAGHCCQLTVLNRKFLLDGDPLKAHLELAPRIAIQAGDPAYIGFTSGSTGEPKGVLCRHGPVTHFLPWHNETFGLRESDRFGLISGLSYSLLHRDIFTALFVGATLYVPSPNDMEASERLSNWLRQTGITILHLTPALGQLLQAVSERILPSLRRVFFAGDVLTRQDTIMIRKSAPNAKTLNFYGATETQRAVGCYEIPEESPLSSDDGTRRVIPLGRGIKDVQLLLLNKNGQLAGIGELGELYVRSPHLATGYVGDDELTQQKFVVNPFTKKSNDRLFRTGEMGRYLFDGNVEWVGRKERRVNIRGFRVELAEVESVLSQYPTVKDAAVVSKPFPSQISIHDLRLVAYVVPELDQPLSIDGLRFFLSARLPDYMVPSHFLILGRLPLTPNGKVDYDALPFWEQSLTAQTDSFVASRNDVEAKLCEIFANVLGIEQIGVNDNFFRLGGHSLLAAQAAARIKEAFGLGLELRTLLESPTVAALAKHIATRLKPPYPTPAIDDKDREEIEL